LSRVRIGSTPSPSSSESSSMFLSLVGGADLLGNPLTPVSSVVADFVHVTIIRSVQALGHKNSRMLSSKASFRADACHQKIVLLASTSQKRPDCGVRRSQKLPYDPPKKSKETPSCTSTRCHVFEYLAGRHTTRASRLAPRAAGSLAVPALRLAGSLRQSHRIPCGPSRMSQNSRSLRGVF
jgi:hypothetical protein